MGLLQTVFSTDRLWGFKDGSWDFSKGHHSDSIQCACVAIFKCRVQLKARITEVAGPAPDPPAAIEEARDEWAAPRRRGKGRGKGVRRRDFKGEGKGKGKGTGNGRGNVPAPDDQEREVPDGQPPPATQLALNPESDFVIHLVERVGYLFTPVSTFSVIDIMFTWVELALFRAKRPDRMVISPSSSC